jgi:hypothetical protein
MTLALGTLVSSSLPAHGAEAIPFREIPLFIVTKSENRNHVVYALRVDERCMPLADAPIHPYWRMLEKGPQATEPLLSREERAYGVMKETVKSDVVRFTLHALPDREITVLAWRAGEACSAAAWTRISGARARVLEVHAVLTWPFGVHHLVLRGTTREGRLVEETIEP